ncbi:MAG TPA: Holliday junction branch migration protein RuvA [Streptosporangiaceae bacterium]|nr:Holliday junction branch migration protein RuvA [Streptosporangiaceae bacterium]
MIAHLDGVVTTVAPEGAVIDVGGVGLLVQCSPGTLAGLRPGERTRVCTSLVVREDALTLYGFGSDDERNTFELLQTASGIGPRLALAMLATFSPDGLRRAVAAEDVTALTSVPGIGRKGAQRIVLELAGRLGSPGEGSQAGAGLAVAGANGAGPGRAGGVGVLTWRDQVRTGLVNLGWQARDADQAIAMIEPELLTSQAAGEPGADGGAANAGEVDVAVALRAALRVLGRS